MSVASKLKGLTAGLEGALEQKSARTLSSSKAAPVQLLDMRTSMNDYEDKIEALEARVKDLESTELPVASIEPNPWQPRQLFDADEIQRLAESIAEVGLIQPIVVRRVQTLDTYQLIAGERRWRAHKVLGKSQIKATVIEAENEDLAVLALVENIGRQDLADYEIAKALRRAETEFPNRKHMAQSLGMVRSDLYRYFAFEDLPDDVKADLESDPRRLGRAAASAIQLIVRKYGEPAKELVSKLWTRVKSGDLDQGKIAATIEAAILRGDAPKTDRDIRKLFVGKEQAGSITRDASHLAIKIKVAALTPEKEVELRAIVERMLG